MTSEKQDCVEHDFVETSSRPVHERWQDRDVDDDELSTSELVSRFNGDVTYEITYTCRHCGETKVEHDI